MANYCIIHIDRIVIRTPICIYNNIYTYCIISCNPTFLILIPLLLLKTFQVSI